MELRVFLFLRIVYLLSFLITFPFCNCHYRGKNISAGNKSKKAKLDESSSHIAMIFTLVQLVEITLLSPLWKTEVISEMLLIKYFYTSLNTLNTNWVRSYLIFNSYLVLKK